MVLFFSAYRFAENLVTDVEAAAASQTNSSKSEKYYKNNSKLRNKYAGQVSKSSRKL